MRAASSPLGAVRRFAAVVRDAAGNYGTDNVPRMAAALAYYSLFSIAPAILIALAVAGFAVGNSAAEADLRSAVSFFAGPAAGFGLSDLLFAIHPPAIGTLTAAVGLIGLAFGGSGVFLELGDSLDAIIGRRTPRRRGVLRIVKARLLAFGMVVAGALLLLAGMVASAALQVVAKDAESFVPGINASVNLVDVGGLFVITSLLVALLYRDLPRPRPTWKAAWFGAVPAAALLVGGEFAVSLYIGRAAPQSEFGTAGSIVAVLVWVYYSAQIFYFGAELTQSFAAERAAARAKEQERAEPARRGS